MWVVDLELLSQLFALPWARLQFSKPCKLNIPDTSASLAGLGMCNYTLNSCMRLLLAICKECTEDGFLI